MRKSIVLMLLLLFFSGCLQGSRYYILDENVGDINGLTWSDLNGIFPLQDVNVANDITLDNITQITNRSYYDLQDVPDLLKLDQSAPQTIVNGIPLLEQDVNAFTELKQLVTKEYVDSAVTAMGVRYYMTDVDDFNGYKLCSLAPDTNTETYIEVSNVVDGQFLGGWISAQGEEPDKLVRGVYNWHMYAEKITGTKDARLYWELIELKDDNTETVVATSAYSDELGEKARYNPFLVLQDDWDVADTSRVVGKVYANVTGSGNAPTVRIYYRGSSGSHWEIPANTEILTEMFVPYTGATKDVNIGNNNLYVGGNLTITGTIDANFIKMETIPINIVSGTGSGTTTNDLNAYIHDFQLIPSTDANARVKIKETGSGIYLWDSFANVAPNTQRSVMKTVFNDSLTFELSNASKDETVNVEVRYE